MARNDGNGRANFFLTGRKSKQKKMNEGEKMVRANECEMKIETDMRNLFFFSFDFMERDVT